MDSGAYLNWPILFGSRRIRKSYVTLFTTVLLCLQIATETQLFITISKGDSFVQTIVPDHGFQLLLQFAIVVAFCVLCRCITELRERVRPRTSCQMNVQSSVSDLPEFSLSQLTRFNGSTETGEIYVALNGKIFDVSDDRRHYKAKGSYRMLAGRDASRAFATLSFDADSLRSNYDDLSDINEIQKSNLCEWETIFKQKYNVIGKLVKNHCVKTLEELTAKAVSKRISLLLQPSDQVKCIDDFPLPIALKRTLHKFVNEHISSN